MGFYFKGIGTCGITREWWSVKTRNSRTTNYPLCVSIHTAGEMKDSQTWYYVRSFLRYTGHAETRSLLPAPLLTIARREKYEKEQTGIGNSKSGKRGMPEMFHLPGRRNLSVEPKKPGCPRPSGSKSTASFCASAYVQDNSSIFWTLIVISRADDSKFLYDMWGTWHTISFPSDGLYTFSKNTANS